MSDAIVEYSSLGQNIKLWSCQSSQVYVKDPMAILVHKAELFLECVPLTNFIDIVYFIVAVLGSCFALMFGPSLQLASQSHSSYNTGTILIRVIPFRLYFALKRYSTETGPSAHLVRAGQRLPNALAPFYTLGQYKEAN